MDDTNNLAKIEVFDRLTRPLDHSGGTTSEVPSVGEMHCGPCGGPRRMNGLKLHMPYSNEKVVLLRCSQCDAKVLMVRFSPTSGDRLVRLPYSRAGGATPRTPEGVAFYLDQAARCQEVGASSAAVAMYRAALEHVLFDQGFTQGMLGAKVTALERAIHARTAPAWALDLEVEQLRLINQLGNGAIHPNDGDVSHQAALDDDLLAVLGVLFAGLLHDVYEADAARAERIAMLRARAAEVDARRRR